MFDTEPEYWRRLGMKTKAQMARDSEEEEFEEEEFEEEE